MPHTATTAERKEAGLRLGELFVERERLRRVGRATARTRFYEPVVLFGVTFILGFFAPAVLSAAVWVWLGKTSAILRHWPFRALLATTVIVAALGALRVVLPLRRKRMRQTAEVASDLEAVERSIAELEPVLESGPESLDRAERDGSE